MKRFLRFSKNIPSMTGEFFSVERCAISVNGGAVEVDGILKWKHVLPTCYEWLSQVKAYGEFSSTHASCWVSQNNNSYKTSFNCESRLRFYFEVKLFMIVYILRQVVQFIIASFLRVHYIF